MKLGPALALLALAACGTGRDFPDAGPFDASAPEPVAVIRYLYDAGLTPATITQDFDGNFVCADARSGVLHVLDADGLGETSTTAVTNGGRWSNPQLSTGRAGQAFLSAHLDDGGNPVWSVNLGDDSVAPFFADATGDGFHARRDDDGFVYASVQVLDGGLFPGPVRLIDGDGGIAREFPMSAWVDDLASAPSGALYASIFGDGGCEGVIRLDTDAGFSLASGSPPCMLGLSRDSQTLWFATASDAGSTQLYRLDAQSLAPLRQWTLDDFTPAFHSVVLSSGGDVALLGIGPANTLAIGRGEWLAQDGGFQIVPSAELPGASDAVFDDLGALYIADPQGHSVDEIP